MSDTLLLSPSPFNFSYVPCFSKIKSIHQLIKIMFCMCMFVDCPLADGIHELQQEECELLEQPLTKVPLFSADLQTPAKGKPRT